MSNTIQAAQAVNAYTSTNQTTNQTTKAPATTTKTTTPQDKVNISNAAQQALANNTKTASSNDVDHDGDSR